MQSIFSEATLRNVDPEEVAHYAGILPDDRGLQRAAAEKLDDASAIADDLRSQVDYFESHEAEAEAKMAMIGDALLMFRKGEISKDQFPDRIQDIFDTSDPFA